MRSGGREQIASVERPRDRLERVCGVRELMGGNDPRPTRGRQEQAVVGADVLPALAVLERQRPTRATDTGVDDREMNADRHVADRVREHERSLEHRLGRDPVRDVDDLRFGGDLLHDAVTRSHEVVLETEVGQERDEHGREPKRPSDASARPLRDGSPALRGAHRPAFSADARTTRADANERRGSLQWQWPADERLPRQAGRISFWASGTRAA